MTKPYKFGKGPVSLSEAFEAPAAPAGCANPSSGATEAAGPLSDETPQYRLVKNPVFGRWVVESKKLIGKPRWVVVSSGITIHSALSEWMIRELRNIPKQTRDEIVRRILRGVYEPENTLTNRP